MGLCASVRKPEGDHPAPLGGVESDIKVTAGTDKERALLAACLAGNLAKAESLIGSGVDVNFGASLTNVSTPLRELLPPDLLSRTIAELADEAIKGGHAEVVERLLELGARVDSVDPALMTPLHLASRRPDPRIIRALLAHPSAAVALKMKDRGHRTPL
jgi:hypothetical protein